MTIHFDPLIRKKQAITHIDDTIMQSQTRKKMFTIINDYHTLLRKVGSKAAPDKTFFFLKKVKFLGHVISPDGIQPIAKPVYALRNLKSPQSKRDVLKVLGCLGLYSCYIKNLHLDSQPFYYLIKILPHSTGLKNMKNCLTPLRNDFTKIQFSHFLLLITRFIFTWTLQKLVQVVFLSNNSLRERELSCSNLAFLTKQSEKCQLFTENYAESYQFFRHMNTIF